MPKNLEIDKYTERKIRLSPTDRASYMPDGAIPPSHCATRVSGMGAKESD